MAEMHSGFLALRSDCPFCSERGFRPAEESVVKTLSHLVVWRVYSAVDAYFAPVAARIAGYSLPVSDQAQAYVDAHLRLIDFRQFHAIGLTFDEQSTYRRDYHEKSWPGPFGRTSHQPARQTASTRRPPIQARLCMVF